MNLTPAEFRALVVEHQDRAQSVAYGLVRDREDAREIAQEAFLKVFLYADRFEERAKFGTWLYRIVVNLSIDTLRKRQPGGRDSLLDEEVKVQSQELSPDEALHGKELLGAMREALDELPDHHREAIVLREIDELSYEEMAEAIGKPIGTVMSRLFYAKKRLQELLPEVL